MFIDFQKLDATTIVRWVLRALLVFLLAWLVRRRPEQDEDEEDDVQEQDEPVARRQGAMKAKARAASSRSVARLQPARDPYANSVRQRRVISEVPPSTGGSFDSIIDKMSKPKEMWEVRKKGEGPPQILRRQPAPQPPEQETSSAAAKATSPASAPTKVAVREAKGKENTLHGHERPVTFISWNRDGNLLFTCGKDKIISVWSTPEGECLGTYRGHSGAVWCCSATADSRWLVTSGADCRVIVWEARTSKEIARVELPGVVRFVEWAGVNGGPTEAAEQNSPTTERFVTCHNRFGSQPAALTLWRFDGESAAIEQLLRITELPSPPTQVRWGRGDEQVVSAHDSGDLVFWRADDGSEVRRLHAHDAPISKFDFTKDFDLVATASTDMSVRVWDVAEGAEAKQIYHAATDRPLNAVAFGRLTRGEALASVGTRPSRCCVVAAGGQDARDVTTSSSTTEQFGTLLFRLGSSEDSPGELEACGVTKGHFGPVHTLAFAGDGSAVASGSEDGCVRLHIFEETPE
mmetsp:Transcript_80924/g.179852  ORF Transcript_80924/g.179852 Transcript_80924/m.179852 type:complete len:520 (-) Transcript_80924:99-1658(-)